MLLDVNDISFSVKNVAYTVQRFKKDSKISIKNYYKSKEIINSKNLLISKGKHGEAN